MDFAPTLQGLKFGIELLNGAIELIHAVRPVRQDEGDNLLAAEQKIRSALRAVTLAQRTTAQAEVKMGQLAKEVERLKQLVKESEGFALKDVGQGAFVYVPSDVHECGEKVPWYCQNCFDAGKKTVLQFVKHDFHFDLHQCPACGAQIRVPNGREMFAATTGQRRRSADLDDF